MGQRRPPDGAMGAPSTPPAGPGSPAKVLDAPSRLPRPTAERRAGFAARTSSLVGHDGVSIAPSSLLAGQQIQPVTTASGIGFRPYDQGISASQRAFSIAWTRLSTSSFP